MFLENVKAFRFGTVQSQWTLENQAMLWIVGLSQRGTEFVLISYPLFHCSFVASLAKLQADPLCTTKLPLLKHSSKKAGGKLPISHVQQSFFQ